MASLVWAFMFLLLAVAGSTMGLVGLIGMSIPIEFQTDLFALAMLVGLGIVLALLSASSTLRETDETQYPTTPRIP
jgi:hypothetical protein